MGHAAIEHRGGTSALVSLETFPGLPDLVAAALAGAVFLGVGQLIGMVARELHEAFGPRRLFAWRSTPAS